MLTNKQFRDFVARVDENICSVQDDKGKLAQNSIGYKILKSPYKYSPKRQKQFDMEAAKNLAEKHSTESIVEVIQNVSPLGRKNKNYGKEILHEVHSYSR